jgi:hypothetical protein
LDSSFLDITTDEEENSPRTTSRLIGFLLRCGVDTTDSFCANTAAVCLNDTSQPSPLAADTSLIMTTADSAGEQGTSVMNADSAADNKVQQAAKAVTSFTQSTSRAFSSSFLPAFQKLTTPKYTMPDKTVASQVLMYRQLLHTKARPGLKLSRDFQNTPAQRAVMHMPWWEQGIEESKKMVISYDNLIVRLWLHGAIMPYSERDTLIDEHGLPPVPHEFWVKRLGFQQSDPVTDFRSGGVLGLGMLVYMVESCPDIVARFRGEGDASVLPFGITCINITDMMAKFLMLSKSVDKMDALLSQKPFWKMFGDPNAILALSEISMSMLCDVVSEIKRERQIPGHENENENRHGERDGNVSYLKSRCHSGVTLSSATADELRLTESSLRFAPSRPPSSGHCL